jgi:DNA-binding MarR family transcriptional regulator
MQAEAAGRRLGPRRELASLDAFYFRTINSSVSETNSLGELVVGFMRAMHRHDGGRTLPLLHRSGLTTPQLAMLELLRAPLTVSALAQRLGLSKPATSQMVDKLVRKRLVHRSEGSVDRRQRSLVASGKGRALLGRVTAARTARFEASLAPLPRELQGRLRRVLADVVVALGSTGGD